jgi:hypothetical protein
MSGLALHKEEITERHLIAENTNNTLIKQSNVTMDASTPLWRGHQRQKEFYLILCPKH